MKTYFGFLLLFRAYPFASLALAIIFVLGLVLLVHLFFG